MIMLEYSMMEEDKGFIIHQHYRALAIALNMNMKYQSYLITSRTWPSDKSKLGYSSKIELTLDPGLFLASFKADTRKIVRMASAFSTIVRHRAPVYVRMCVYEYI